jgi:hypothetical protein
MPSISAQEGRAEHQMTVSEYQLAGDGVAQFFCFKQLTVLGASVFALL